MLGFGSVTLRGLRATQGVLGVNGRSGFRCKTLMGSWAVQGLLRVTTSWLQTCSNSGRISSENPNMQCVPKAQTFMMGSSEKDGRKGDPLEANLRFVNFTLLWGAEI